MQELFEPIRYESMGQDLGDRVVSRLVDISKAGPTAGHRIRKTVQEALERVEPQKPEVAVALQAAADQLDSPKREQFALPQTLFSESEAIKLDHERAACERRLAAWLYLEHRVHAGQRSSGDPVLALWRSLGQQVANDLLRPGSDEADFDLSLHIYGLVQEAPSPMEQE